MLEILTLVVTPFGQNARLLIDQQSKHCLVVDPGGEVSRITAVIEKEEVRVTGVFLTHSHLDHGGGVEGVLCYCQQAFGERPLLFASGEEERGMRASLSSQAVMYGLAAADYCNVPEPDRVLCDGMRVDFGRESATALFTPGHSPGHYALYFEPVEFVAVSEDNRADSAELVAEKRPLLLAGDVLFAGSIGRTDLPGGNYQRLMRSIDEKFLSLPDDTWVASGHGPDTTMGQERRTNPFIAQ